MAKAPKPNLAWAQEFNYLSACCIVFASEGAASSVSVAVFAVVSTSAVPADVLVLPAEEDMSSSEELNPSQQDVHKESETSDASSSSNQSSFRIVGRVSFDSISLFTFLTFLTRVEIVEGILGTEWGRQSAARSS